MYWKYEKACMEADVEEMKIRKIRAIFDDDRKKLKKENRIIEEMEYIHFSIDETDNARKEAFGIPDESCNVEEEAIDNVNMAKLLSLLNQLNSEEKEVILNYFDASVNFSAFARKKGVSRDSLIRKAKRIFRDLQKAMGTEKIF